jgi:tagatose 1,6-diphosphate aldolase
MSTAERRAYQQICGENGAILAIACDQRGGIRNLLASTKEEQAGIGDNVLGEIKADIARYLARHAAAVLVDPITAFPGMIETGALHRETALIIGLDDSGYDVSPEGYRLSRLVPGISARRVRDLGGDAGKIMVYLRADRPSANAQNIAMLRAAIADFAAENVLLIVEFLTYGLPGESEVAYHAKVPALVLAGARVCLDLGAKVLKLPYPGSAEACAAVTRLLGPVPWAVLSAGMDHEVFLGQVDTAMSKGAAGVIAGRSLWKDCVSFRPAERHARLESHALPRLEALKAVLAKHRPA